MTIRDDLKQFLANEPFSNLLTPEEIEALARWVERIGRIDHAHRLKKEVDGWSDRKKYACYAQDIMCDDLAAKLKRLEEAGCQMDTVRPWGICVKKIDEHGKFIGWIPGPDVNLLSDIPKALDAAISELDRIEKKKKS
jgi:hypothetical protein